MLQALQGSLNSPLALIFAGIGLLLMSIAVFFPMAEFEQPESDEGTVDVFYYSQHAFENGIEVDLGMRPGILLLVLAVAASAALTRAPNWLQFGRLASLGLGVMVMVSELARVQIWLTSIESQIDRDIEELTAAGTELRPDDEATMKAIKTINPEFTLGMWLLLGGLLLLTISVLFMRSSAPLPTVPPIGYPAAMTPQQPGAMYQPPQAGPRTSLQDAPTVTVHDDPPSLSIYKPPKSDRR